MKTLNLILFSTCLVFLAFSCSSTSTTTKSSSGKKTFPKTIYYVDADQDGTFEAIELEDKPVPFQGKDQWTRDFYSSIKYPPSARNNGVSGIVLLDILIDEFGKVQEVKIKKGLSKDCDEAAKVAFRNSILQGYSPAKLDTKAVKCRMDLPVGFWLE